MFKKWLTKYSLGILLSSLCYNTAYAEINVFACEPEWAALTNTLGGNAVNVFSATTAQQDPHHIQARPSLIAKTRSADLLVCTGADLEVGWLPVLMRKSGNADIQPGNAAHFLAANQISLLEKPTVLDRSNGDVHADGNPHFQFDPYRIQKIANALTETLIKLDAGNRDLYQKNLVKFTNSWQQAIPQWEQRAQALKGKKIVVNHNSWVYLEQWLGLERVATLEPKPGIPPTSRHLSQVLSQLKQNPADMILLADYQDPKPANWLSEKTALPVIDLPFSVKKGNDLKQFFDELISQLTNTAS